MHSAEEVPAIDGRFICIVDRESAVLAAVISSYLYLPRTYLPMFLFPKVDFSMLETDVPFGDQYQSNLMGRAASTYINNAWARLGPRDNVILIGLSDEQKSYLFLPEGVRIIQIASMADVGPQLASFSTRNIEEIRCTSLDMLRGLAIALKDGKRLVIDEEAQIAPCPGENRAAL